LKLGIIGLAGSGKSTVFRALTGGVEPGDRHGHQEPGLGVVKVEDNRLDFLADYHKRKRSHPWLWNTLIFREFQARREPPIPGGKNSAFSPTVGRSGALHRFFDSPAIGQPQIEKDFLAGEEELILSDLAVVEETDRAA